MLRGRNATGICWRERTGQAAAKGPAPSVVLTGPPRSARFSQGRAVAWGLLGPPEGGAGAREVRVSRQRGGCGPWAGGVPLMSEDPAICVRRPSEVRLGAPRAVALARGPAVGWAGSPLPSAVCSAVRLSVLTGS